MYKPTPLFLDLLHDYFLLRHLLMCIILGTRQMYRLNALTAYLIIVLGPCFSLLDPLVSVSLNKSLVFGLLLWLDYYTVRNLATV